MTTTDNDDTQDSQEVSPNDEVFHRTLEEELVESAEADALTANKESAQVSSADVSTTDDDDDDESLTDDNAPESGKKSKKKEKKDKHKIKFHALMQRREAVTYFRSLIDGLESGRIAFKQDETDIVLNPAEQLEVEIKAVSKGDKQKVSFEFEWRATKPNLEIDN